MCTHCTIYTFTCIFDFFLFIVLHLCRLICYYENIQINVKFESDTQCVYLSIYTYKQIIFVSIVYLFKYVSLHIYPSDCENENFTISLFLLRLR